MDANDPSIKMPEANVRGIDDFPDDEFLNIKNVPVFSEHESVTPKGRKVKFTYDELKVVADRSNRRIDENGDYAVISIGHTLSPKEKSSGAREPDVVGFAGPFRIGRIGKKGKRKRFAVLADFHVFRDDIKKYRKNPRRSPELWLEQEYADMFLDPIALLGAEAPRLDLGLLYSASRHGIEIEKYAAVSPGGFNSYIPGENTKKYQSHSILGDNQMLGQDDLKQIVDAIEQTEVFQFVRSEMMEQTQPGDGGGDIVGDQPENPDKKDYASTNDNPEEGENPYKKSMYAAMDSMCDEEINKYMAGRKKRYEADCDDDKDKKDYQADGSADGDINKETDGSAEGEDAVVEGSASDQDNKQKYSRNGEVLRYQRLQTQVRDQGDELTSLRERLNYERGARVDAERIQRLQDLRFEGYNFDPAEEIEKFRYSKMSNEIFDQQVEFIQKHCERIPMHSLPYSPDSEKFSPNRPGGEAERTKYSKGNSDKAMKMCEAKLANGEQPDYEEELQQILNGQAK